MIARLALSPAVVREAKRALREGATPAPGTEVDAGTGVDLAAGTATRGGDDDGLAPFAVFSAASQRQVAFETYDVDGRTRVGSLS